MIVIGIDPGPTKSGFVIFDGTCIVEADEAYENAELLDFLRDTKVDGVVIERVQFYGRLFGATVLDTVWWSGRFHEAAQQAGSVVHRVYWNDVKRQFVPGARIDAVTGKKKKITERDVQLGVIDRFGGKAAAVGTKKAPGPLKILKTHAWSAMALAVWWWDRASSAGLAPPMTTAPGRQIEAPLSRTLNTIVAGDFW